MSEKQEVANNIDDIIPDDQNLKTSSKLVFIRRAIIKDFFFTFDYHSSKMDYEKLLFDKDLLEILNLTNINSFKIRLKKFDSNDETKTLMTINEFLKLLIKYWQNDIVSNQVFKSAINSLGVIRPFKKILDGFVGIFKIPYKKGIRDGFAEGLKNFVISCSSQSLFLGENVHLLLYYIYYIYNIFTISTIYLHFVLQYIYRI